MSVFRFGSVGPKFQPKELSKNYFNSFEWKGKWLKFHYFLKKKDLKEETLLKWTYFLFDCRTR